MRCLDGEQLLAIASTGLRQSASAPGAAAPLDPVSRVTWVVAEALADHHRARATLPDALPRAVASRALSASLARRLRRHLGQLLLAELEVYRARHESPWQRLAALSDPATSAETVRGFCGWLGQGALAARAERLPPLLPLLGQTVAGWWRNATLFFERLDRDLDDVALFLGHAGGAARPAISNLLFDLGDLHEGGLTVSGVRLEGGGAALLKPRHPLPDQLYLALVAWINRRSGRQWFRAPALLSRETYFWTTYIDHRACQSEEGVAAYYERAGALLALCHVLNLGDSHHENVIAAGEFPVIVDLETLLTVQRLGDRRTATRAAHAHLGQSVLRLGLLPNWQPVGEAGWLDNAALGSGVAPGELQRSYVASNLAASAGPAAVAIGQNVPTLDGARCGADAYVSDICRGFEEMRRFLVAHRAEFTRLVASYATRREFEARVVLRATLYYAMAFERAGQPQALESDARRQAALTPPLMMRRSDSDGVARRLQRAERRQLLAGDIPLFRVSARAAELTAPAAEAALPLPGFEPGLVALERRLEEMARWGERPYRETICWSFEGRVAVHPGRKVALAPGWPPTDPASDEQLLAEARRLGDQLVQSAIWGDDGSATWLVPSFADDGRGYGVRPANHTLYIGRSGIALFLVSLAAAGGGARYAAVARAALEPLVRRLPEQIGSGQFSCGAVSGYGATIYAAAEVAHLLGDRALLESVVSTVGEAELATRLGDAPPLDVMDGVAGLLLSLVTLWWRRESAVLAALIAALAARLRDASFGDGRYRFGADGHEMTGFSHGNAGIAHALLAAHRVTGDVSLQQAARAAIDRENDHFRAEHGNWQDLRSEGAESGMVAWCNGASGIGLGRLLWLDHHAAARRDVETALARTAGYAPGGTQHLCCGDAGRIALLLAAAQPLQRPSLATAARRRAAWLIERAARHEGRYVLVFGQPAGSEANPSLFRGIAGLGHLYLRLVAPHTMPDPLTLLPAEWGARPARR